VRAMTEQAIPWQVQKHAELQTARDAIQRVRELHERYDEIQFGTTICGGCSDIDHGIFMDYPCPTIKELNGESNA
jgi:hypothetical protein